MMMIISMNPFPDELFFAQFVDWRFPYRYARKGPAFPHRSHPFEGGGGPFTAQIIPVTAVTDFSGTRRQFSVMVTFNLSICRSRCISC